MNVAEEIPTADDRLALILADLAERQRLGKGADVEQAAREHPDLAEELRSLWATAQFAATFASPAAASTGPGFGPASTTPPPPESFGDYEILEELGRGGMGVVYKARQRSLNRMVAVKVMREARLSSETDRARFLAEAAAAAKLKHPNIVTVFEVGHQNGLPYIVMEYVPGRTLSQQLAEGPLPPRIASKLIADVARAVHHAHERNILHRDLKPANILLSNPEPGTKNPEPLKPSLSGRESNPSALNSELRTPNSEFKKPNDLNIFEPKVTDFGLARRLHTTEGSNPDWRTQTGAIVGTPGYMSPEQATCRRELTAAADVYSLGAILYESLTGRPPFQASNAVDALFMVVEQDPVSPRLLLPGLDRDLEMICLKCLQKPVDLRYETAAELADDLEAHLSGEAVSSQPSGFGYLFARLMRETHHIGVLENWGMLWMWHSLAVFLLCLLTQVMEWVGVSNHGAYLALWSVGLVTWGIILWRLRRRAGPVLFVERQIAHAWAAGVISSIMFFLIEVIMGYKVLSLSPAIAVSAGMIFVLKAGILTGRFYVLALLMFATALVMPLFAEWRIILLGFTMAISFFVPGLKYYRQRKRGIQTPTANLS